MSLGKSLSFLELFRGEEADPGDELHHDWIIHLTREDLEGGLTMINFTPIPLRGSR